jgi:hypothetical protein
MPQYYFHVHDARVESREFGETLADDDAAWKEATLVAGELFKDIDGAFRPGQDWSLEITDAQRVPLFLIKVTGHKLQ